MTQSQLDDLLPEIIDVLRFYADAWHRNISSTGLSSTNPKLVLLSDKGTRAKDILEKVKL